ncbi:eukaryotic translation initiation factor 2D-like [Saccoglossus kowalevskii]|uniref:Eukaryotic translation initiation factor 2D-like n=1 Tax=Saccoglossus kowalevskii TaxID=10224 RepID=A0ABM0H1F2_SACKO|nr:PREDICTED: eukaryotic translation initiation factor 2D-like [Saccoglossus kowalevskii]
MFHKPFRVRSNTTIKGSDRRKLRSEVRNQFPRLAEDDLNVVVPNKDEMTVMKIYSHAGDNVIVYCLHKNPIFFEVEKKLFPTVYTVWKYPTLVPVFTTWENVFRNLSGGADLMLPGVVLKVMESQSLPLVDKGDVCLINTAGNHAAIAIGTAAMSTGQMMAAGMRGKGIFVYHTYQDQLWQHGDKIHLPVIPMEVPGMNTMVEKTFTEIDTEELKTDDNEEVPNIEVDSEEKIETSLSEIENLRIDDGQDEDCDIEGAVGGEIDEEWEAAGDENPRTLTEQMDDLLQTCFLHALKTNVNKKNDLPLLTSKFFRNHLLPCCPAGRQLDVKKSSYKKLSKFLQEMKKKKFIEMKQLQKGVDSITDVHKEHPDVRAFQIPNFTNEVLEETEIVPPSGEYHSPEIIELFAVNAATLPLFQTSGYSKGSWLTQQQVRSALTDYVKSNELIDPNNKSQVVLDPHLTDALLQKSEYHISHVKWDALFQRCYTKMGSGYQLTFPGQTISKNSGIKKGKVPSITINVEKRTGNKKVTLVQNLEVFGIDPKSFARTVQVNVAASTSISPLPGNGAGFQVLIQGNQINYVAQLLLDEFKILKKYIVGLEKAPKPPKKKN